jgi:hypothetical protein
MDRRGFLKNIFGAAVIAAMPKIVVEQIETLPEAPISPAINGVTPIFTKKVPVNGLFYIYDDKEEKLIATSTNFNIRFEQKYIKHVPGLLSWDLSAENIQWIENPRQVFEENRKLRYLILKNGNKISGDVYITQLEYIAPQYEQISSSAEFKGSGALILEANENNH